MLIHNGFVCEENRHDSVKMKLGLSTQDPLMEKRVNVLEKFGLKRYRFKKKLE